MAVAVAAPAGWLGLQAKGWTQAAREGTSLLLLPLFMVAANGLRVPTCDWGEALRFYLLLPVTTATLASGWGVALGRLFESRRRGLCALLLVGVASVAHSLFLLYDQAAIFSYDPIFGFWPGALYDEALSVPDALPLARLYHLLSTLTALSVVRLWCSPLAIRPRLQCWGPALGALLLLCLVQYHGPTLGFFQSKQTLSRVLHQRLDGPGLRIHLDPSLEPSYGRALLEDVTYQRLAIAKLLDVSPERWPTVDLFIYRTSAQRKKLMGADLTTVAKAWRGQVHMLRPEPGSTLITHELTHLLAAAITDPLLGMPRQGLLPVMGLVEGLAVAAAGKDLGPGVHGAAAAMRRLKLTPPVAQLMGFWGFYGLSPRRAYPAAGSFVRFLLEQHGAAVVRKAYGSGDISGATGQSMATLEAEWLQMLDAITLSDRALAEAEINYRQEAVYRRVCPHEIALQKRRAARLVSSRPEDAVRALERIIAWDPEDPAHLMDLARLRLKVGDEAGARQAATRCLNHPKATRTLGSLARVSLADLDWLTGQGALAVQAYEAAQANSPGGSQGRALRVKLDAARRGKAGEVVRDYLLARRTSDVSLLRLQAASMALSDWGVPAYLIGRRLYNGSDFDVAAKWFDQASKAGLEDPLIRAENLRLLGRALYRAGQRSAAAEAFSTLTQIAPTTGYAEGAHAWLTRCRNDAVTGNRPAGQIVGGM